MKCSVEGCNNEKYHSKLYCSMHYRRLKFTGTLDGGPRERLPLEQRFWKRVEKQDSGCWVWTGSTNTRGYGLVGEGGRQGKYLMTHRYSYTIHKGDIPKGMLVMHSCDNPACVNPDHLSLGTPKDNTQDAVSKGRIHNGKRPSKLTDEQVLFIKENLEFTGVQLAERFGVSKAAINAVRKGRNWTHIKTDVEYPGRRPKMKKVTPRKFGEDHPRSKLTEEKVRFIRASSGTSVSIAKEVGVSANCVRQIKAGMTWKHIV